MRLQTRFILLLINLCKSLPIHRGHILRWEKKNIIATVDASPLLGPYFGAPYSHTTDIETGQNMGIVVKEGSDNKLVIPTSRQRYKQSTRSIMKHVAICKSPFVA